MTTKAKAKTKATKPKTIPGLNTNQSNMIEALRISVCNVSVACTKANVSRSMHYYWLTKSDIYKKEVENLKEGLIDRVESALYKNIIEGNVTAQIFFLKTKGKDRGYIETQELNFGNTPEIEIKFV